MSNKNKYGKIFMVCFSINESDLNKELLYNSTPAWDSVGHMTLIGDLEEAFDVVLEMDDIIDLSSFDKGMEILSKHGIIF